MIQEAKSYDEIWWVMMSTYLTRKGTEVRNMFFGEYDYDLDMKVKAQEAAEEAAEKKAVEAAIFMVRKYKADPETAAKDMNAPLELVLEGLKKQVPVQA